MQTESLFNQTLSNSDFELICSRVYDYCGISISAAKRQMVEGRLRKRVRALELPSFTDYCSAVFRNGAFHDEFIGDK